MESNSLIKKIEKAGLLGRGCGTFPVAKKWSLVAAQKHKEKYVICNASESEPGIFKDKYILEHFPEKVIDGMAIAIRLLKAQQGFIYMKPDYYHQFGKKIQVMIGDDDIEIFAKPMESYIGGEESAMINIMQGERLEPRLKPPMITEAGLWNKPTLVNNVETFYDISLIAQGKYNQERFFCVSGDGFGRHVLQMNENSPVKQALEKVGWPDFNFFVQLGGAMAGTCLRSGQLEDYTIQHYSGLVVRDMEKDEHELILDWLKFFASESCGQCVPCREGTYRLYNMYRQGNYDKQLFSDIIFSMRNSSLCSLGKMAVEAVSSYYTNIKKEALGSDGGEGRKCD